MAVVVLATPYLSSHFDSGNFFAASLSRAKVPFLLWDYRREKNPPVNYADVLVCLKGNSQTAFFSAKKRICYWPDALGRDKENEALLAQYHDVYTCLRPTPPNMKWLPTGFDPYVHYPRTGEKNLDTIFIGTATERKMKFMSVIQPTALFGNGWGEQISDVYLDDYCHLLSRAKISLNVHRDEVGVNRRFFESIACNFTLTDIVPGVEEILGTDIMHDVGFSTPDEARVMVQYYLKHEKDRLKIWQRQQVKILPYSYDETVKTMLKGIV